MVYRTVYRQNKLETVYRQSVPSTAQIGKVYCTMDMHCGEWTEYKLTELTESYTSYDQMQIYADSDSDDQMLDNNHNK